MKVSFPGVLVVVLIALFSWAGPAFSQDGTQPSTPGTVQPSSPEATQPAQPEAVQPSMQQPAQPAPSEAAQPATPMAGQASAREAGQPAVQLAEAVVCQDVVDRKPVGSADVFPKEVPKVYCFTRVVGAAPGTQLTQNWYYKGTLKASVKLNVGSSNYRTWSSKTMMPEWAGQWMVEILAPDGKPLESIIFILK
jgi:Protein of unknown function (DUF2914)